MAPTAENGVISPLFTLEEDPEALVFAHQEKNRKLSPPISACFFDLDDTLYPRSSGLASACVKNIEDYMVQRLGFPADTAGEEAIRLYTEHGTTMAGLRAEGYAFDFDDWHAFVHGRLPYHLLKPDPALRELLESLPHRKIVFTNADRAHASRCLRVLGLEGCFDVVIALEDIMDQRPSRPFSHRNVFFAPSTSTSAPDSTPASETMQVSVSVSAYRVNPPSCLPPIPSSSSTASLPSSALPSNRNSSSSSPEHPAHSSSQDQQVQEDQAHQPHRNQQQETRQSMLEQMSLPRVPPFQCASRRCISVDGLLEHAAAHPLSADPAAATSAGAIGCCDACGMRRATVPAAGAAPGAADGKAAPAPHTPQENARDCAGSSLASAASSWLSPAGALICCKPQAEAFHRAVITIASANPLSSIMFDDSTRNIAAAKNFGMQTVLVGASHRSPGADHVISDIHEMKRRIPALWKLSEKSVAETVGEDVLESPCMHHQNRSLGLVLA
ncbi:hypothetical protein CLOM_g12060 [Closterium sp. NIES-68]|nr:hypothetical protein CLOM_g12060 [Closterium sp. NIES-68]GJP57971.1 hypothetical protein CLOP_g19887 [Closterium sp. NIES-67]